MKQAASWEAYVSLTFLDELTAGVLDAGRTWFSTASRVRTILRTLLVTAAIALKRIGHSDQGVYDFRCPWRDLARRCRDTKKTRGPGRAGIHIHIQIVHACARLLRPFSSPRNNENNGIIYLMSSVIKLKVRWTPTSASSRNKFSRENHKGYRSIARSVSGIPEKAQRKPRYCIAWNLMKEQVTRSRFGVVSL